MISLILIAFLMMVFLFILGYGLKTRTDEASVASVVLMIFAALIFGVVSWEQCKEYDNNMARMESLQESIGTKKGELTKIETELQEMKTATSQEIVKYVSKCYEISEKQKELDSDIKSHNELVSKLSNLSPWFNVSVYLDKRWENLKMALPPECNEMEEIDPMDL